MAANKSITFQIAEVNTIPIKIELSIPPTGPGRMQGVITVHCIPKSKEDFKKLTDEELSDADYFDRIVTSVEGLGKKNSAGEMVALEGEDAMHEVKEGKYSLYFLSAIIGAYFEQYGEARRKNSNSSSKR